jgi:hypothetical protein
MDDHEFLYFCPITNNIFEDPVKAEDGRTYEREGIEGNSPVLRNSFACSS